MIIKVILIVFFVVFALYLTRAEIGARGTAWGRLAMLGFCVVAIFSATIPSITTRIAHLIGVGRGTDLLLYLLVLVFLLTQLATAKHRNRQERRITRLAREIAINHALIQHYENASEVGREQKKICSQTEDGPEASAPIAADCQI